MSKDYASCQVCFYAEGVRLQNGCRYKTVQGAILVAFISAQSSTYRTRAYSTTLMSSPNLPSQADSGYQQQTAQPPGVLLPNGGTKRIDAGLNSIMPSHANAERTAQKFYAIPRCGFIHVNAQYSEYRQRYGLSHPKTSHLTYRQCARAIGGVHSFSPGSSR